MRSAEAQLTAEKLYKEVGSRVKQKRKSKSISQEQLAKRVGLNRASINNIEHGRHKVLLDTLWQIACTLEIQVMDLIPQLDDMVFVPPTDSFPQNTPDDIKKWLTPEVPQE